MNLKNNKRGGIGLILFFFMLLSILLIGFVAVMVWSVVDFASDTVTPIMTELGMAGETNISEAATYSFGTANTIVQSLPWVIAFSYAMALIFVLVFVFIIGYSPHPAFIGFFLALMILLIFGCVLMSNMYQDIYSGTDEISIRLQEQVMMSHMILYSPLIMGIIAIIGGIIMFTRLSSNDGTGGVSI